MGPPTLASGCMNQDGTPEWRMAPSPHGPYWQEGEKLGYQDCGCWTLMKSTPIDRRNHVWHLIVSMPRGMMCKSEPTRTAISRFVETFPSVIAEDEWALEKQQKMFDYPDDGYVEVFLKPDTALRRARLILNRMERQETPAAPKEIAAQ